jgi:hypothetical protein
VGGLLLFVQRFERFATLRNFAEHPALDVRVAVFSIRAACPDLETGLET